MIELKKQFDLVVVGGGLAGLSVSILAARAGLSVALFEKEDYPFHKVCGEYISLESKNFLLSLGLPVHDLSLPSIKKLFLSSPDGSSLKHPLPLGGIGVSRFFIDEALFRKAVDAGVIVYAATRVNDIVFKNGYFNVEAGGFTVQSRLCCGAYGKRSNIDIKWKRAFVRKKPGVLNNFIGVKYHVVLNHPRDEIALHHFSNGYCGISPVEEGKSCICYLTSAANLRTHGNNIRELEEQVLFRNPFIHEAFSGSEFLYNKPLTISQISFDRKDQVENHVIMIGDAAGMITPLCGNGMSMALLGAQMAAPLMVRFCEGRLSRSELETEYMRQWRKQFSKRLYAGRIIQSLFGNNQVANLFIRTIRNFPSMVDAIIRQTHGSETD